MITASGPSSVSSSPSKSSLTSSFMISATVGGRRSRAVAARQRRRRHQLVLGDLEAEPLAASPSVWACERAVVLVTKRSPRPASRSSPTASVPPAIGSSST